MGINKVLIVGSGLMGSGIAQVCAQSGIQVILNDISKDTTEKGLKSIAWSVGKFIEKGIRLAFGRRMGPFETGDLVGLDVSNGALMAIYEESRDIRYYPPQLLRRKVKSGQLGRKTGMGWYAYNEDGSRKED